MRFKTLLQSWYLLPLLIAAILLHTIEIAASAIYGFATRASDRVSEHTDAQYARFWSRKNASEVRALWHDLSKWSQATFGKDSERGPIGPLEHIKLEVEEAKVLKSDGTYDVVEFADIGILWFDAARRAGFTLDEIILAMRDKLSTNKLREWPKPTQDEPVLHVD